MAFLYVGFHDQMHAYVDIPDPLQKVHEFVDRGLNLSRPSIDLWGTHGQIASVSVDPDLLDEGSLPEAERQEIADALLRVVDSVRSGGWPDAGQQPLANMPSGWRPGNR